MKYLAIDYGSKRVGTAVSDAAGTIAFPRTILLNNEKLFPSIQKLIEEEKIGTIVVGDTRSHGGGENPVTAATESFVAKLETDTALPVERVWEIWSSIEASRYAEKGNEHNDAAAAAIILQRFLDMKTTK